MNLREFVFMFVQSLNPFSYKNLITKRKRDAVKYFIYIVLFSVLVTSIINLPSFFSFPSTVQRLNFTSLGEEIVLLREPKIVLDFSGHGRNLTDEALIITETEIIQWKLKPDFSLFSMFSQVKRTIPVYFYWILLLFLLPSYLFISYISTFFKYFFVVLLLIIIGVLFKIITGRDLKVAKIYMAASYSITLPILLNSIMLLTGINLFVIVSYPIFFILVMLVITKKDLLN